MALDRANDLLLLLSMSGLAAGCSKGVATDGAVPFGPGPGSSADSDDDEDAETGDPESTEGSGGGSESDPILTSGPGTTSGDSITIDPTDATTSGPPETTSVTDPASSSGPAEDSSSSGLPGSTGDTSQTGDACADYAVWAQDCYGYDDGQEWCEYRIAYGTAYYGVACGSAVEELFACVSTQNCGAVGCAAEDMAVQNAC